MSNTVTIANVSAEYFEALVGDGFRIDYPGHVEMLTLARVQRGGATPPGSGRAEGFSLFFQGASTTVVLAQFTHRVTHDALGALDIFLVPVAREADGTHRYQAVFN